MWRCTDTLNAVVACCDAVESLGSHDDCIHSSSFVRSFVSLGVSRDTTRFWQSLKAVSNMIYYLVTGSIPIHPLVDPRAPCNQWPMIENYFSISHSAVGQFMVTASTAQFQEGPRTRRFAEISDK